MTIRDTLERNILIDITLTKTRRDMCHGGALSGDGIERNTTQVQGHCPD